MLEVDRIAVFYGDTQALFDVSLRVEAGEIVTLLGSNGAGKSTTVNTISGLLRPRAGDVRFLGQSLTGLRPHAIVEAGLVQVPEGRMLFPQMQVIENLRMGAYARSARRAQAEQLDLVFHLFPRLDERRVQLAGSLSGGEQQMLAIGRGLMASPRLLVLDEPSIGLAPTVVAEMFRAIREIQARGVTVLLIEQNAARALECASRAYLMENGRMVTEGRPQDFLENSEIRAAYLGI